MKKLVFVVCAVAGLVGTSFAGTQFYDQYGQYQGQAVPRFGGGYSFYNNYGQYQGQAVPRFGGGYSYYNGYGQYQGQSFGH